MSLEDIWMLPKTQAAPTDAGIPGGVLMNCQSPWYQPGSGPVSHLLTQRLCTGLTQAQLCEVTGLVPVLRRLKVCGRPELTLNGLSKGLQENTPVLWAVPCDGGHSNP